MYVTQPAIQVERVVPVHTKGHDAPLLPVLTRVRRRRQPAGVEKRQICRRYGVARAIRTPACFSAQRPQRVGPPPEEEVSLAVETAEYNIPTVPNKCWVVVAGHEHV